MSKTGLAIGLVLVCWISWVFSQLTTQTGGMTDQQVDFYTRLCQRQGKAPQYLVRADNKVWQIKCRGGHVNAATKKTIQVRY